MNWMTLVLGTAYSLISTLVVTIIITITRYLLDVINHIQKQNKIRKEVVIFLENLLIKDFKIDRQLISISIDSFTRKENKYRKRLFNISPESVLEDLIVQLGKNNFIEYDSFRKYIDSLRSILEEIENNKLIESKKNNLAYQSSQERNKVVMTQLIKPFLILYISILAIFAFAVMVKMVINPILYKSLLYRQFNGGYSGTSNTNAVELLSMALITVLFILCLIILHVLKLHNRRISNYEEKESDN